MEKNQKVEPLQNGEREDWKEPMLKFKMCRGWKRGEKEGEEFLTYERGELFGYLEKVISQSKKEAFNECTSTALYLIDCEIDCIKDGSISSEERSMGLEVAENIKRRLESLTNQKKDI